MPADQFRTFVLQERERFTQRLRTSILVAVLIAALIYLTQWIALRPGLVILFIGQAGLSVSLFFRLSRLKKELNPHTLDEVNLAAWFQREQSFVNLAALFESICHTIGFALLGYAFWLSTGSRPFALALGLVYPAVHYFGITRRTTRKAIRRLDQAQRSVLTTL